MAYDAIAHIKSKMDLIMTSYDFYEYIGNVEFNVRFNGQYVGVCIFSPIVPKDIQGRIEEKLNEVLTEFNSRVEP